MPQFRAQFCAAASDAPSLARLQAGSKLPRAIVTQILRRCFALQQPMPNVRRVNLKPGQRLTVVGDLHGQLADLLHIFSQNGWPDENSLYVFNGDFVDRGPCGVEVVLALYAWQLCLPDCVFLNRGNHEDMRRGRRRRRRRNRAVRRFVQGERRGPRWRRDSVARDVVFLRLYSLQSEARATRAAQRSRVGHAALCQIPTVAYEWLCAAKSSGLLSASVRLRFSRSMNLRPRKQLVPAPRGRLGGGVCSVKLKKKNYEKFKKCTFENKIDTL